jgi:hypothetical protein
LKKALVLLNIVLLLLPKITGNGTVEQLKNIAPSENGAIAAARHD